MADVERGELERLFADKVPARVISAATGAFLAGPAGAIVGAAMAPVVEHLLSTGNQRFVNNAERMLEQAAELSGHRNADDLRSYVETDDQRLALTVDAARYASDTLSERKLLSLARVLGYGLSDDAYLDMATLYLRALRDLEPVHIRVLATFEARRSDPSEAAREGIMTDEDLEVAHPNLRDGLGPIVATLERENLVMQALVDGNASFESIGGRAITSFGQRVLAWTRAAVE